MRLFPPAVILLLSWGALAMGGAPSWAAAPTLVFAVATGLIGFLEGGPPLRHHAVMAALCVLLAAVGAQSIPLPAPVVASLSPARGSTEFERALATADRRDPDLVLPLADDATRPLSIAPSRAWIGLAVVGGFAILLAGLSWGLTAVGAPAVVRLVAILGVAVAFLGMYQLANGSSALYGWYYPISQTSRYAPFINRNHQAGWLVMTLSLTLGAFAGEVARGMRGMSPTWRDRILWLSSKDANVTLLLLFASVVMGIAVLLTLSRSGVSALVLALTVLALWTRKKQESSTRRRVVTIGIAVVAAAGIWIAGDAVAARFAASSREGANVRFDAWADSVNILRDFWLTGTGFNTYGVAMLRYQTANTNIYFIEAHNDYLQLAVESGLLVGIPALLLAASLLLEIRRRFREGADDTRTYWLRVGAVAGLAGIALQSLVEFTLQMPGGAVMFATLLAIAIHHPRPRAARGEYHA